MKTSLLIYLLFCGTFLRLEAQSDSKIKGTIILDAIAGSDAANVSFVSIEWTNSYGGFVIDDAGTKTTFFNSAVRRIFYYDAAYYEQIDERSDWFTTRFSIKKYEYVTITPNAVNLSQSDLKQVQIDEESLELAAQSYSSSASLLQPKIDLLKDDISRLSLGQQMLNGKWMTAEEIKNLPPAPKIGGDKVVTFRSKAGKLYEHVIVHIGDTGLSVLSSDGGTTLPFDQLPDDLSPFPDAIRKAILIQRQAAAQTASSTTDESTSSASNGNPPNTNSTVDAGQASDASEAARKRAIADKLESIIIDKVNFDKLDVATVVQYLEQKSKELDPNHEGINFVLLLPSDSAATSGSSSAGKAISREVSITLTDVPISDILGYIIAQTNLQYTVDDYAVYLHPPAIGNSSAVASVSSASDPGSISVQKKLDLIKISLDFSNATLEEATRFLSVESKRLDPDHQGVVFVIQPEASTKASPVTLTLNNIPLGEALKYLCLLANVQYSIQDNSINVSVPISQ